MIKKSQRRSICSLWLIMGLCIAANVVQGQSFIKEFDDAGCSIRIPDSMNHSKQMINTRVGKITYHTYYCEQAMGENGQTAVFQFSYCDYPSSMKMSSSLQDSLLIESIHSSVNNLNGLLIYRNAIQMEGYPGYIWRIHYNKGKAVMKSKALFRGRRFYLLQVAALKEVAIDQSISSYFDSFRLR